VKTEVFDVCGAGDTFLSGFVFSYLKTPEFISAIKFANKCAAVSVRHFGTYAITLEDIARFDI